MPAAAARPPVPPAAYYLSLGDSLSQGLQPRPGHAGGGRETSAGYPDVVAADLGRAGGRRLQLVKLGCPGETTTTMMHGGICYRGGRSQLAAATAFLRTHRGRVALITVDIGINDVVRCEAAAPSPRSVACLGRGTAALDRNLPVILADLRRAAGGPGPATPPGGPGPAMVALDYYAPFVEGSAAHTAWSEFVTGRLDAVISRVSRRAGVEVAAVAGRFGGGQARARQAGAVCRLTWMCSPPPVGANLHANAAGYRAMAAAVEQALSSGGAPSSGGFPDVPGPGPGRGVRT